MKQKLIIGFSVLLLLAVVYLIGSDLFTNTSKNDENPTDYNIDKLRQIDSTLICYEESNSVHTQLNGAYGMAIDENNTLYITGNKRVSIFNSKGAKTGGFSIDTIAHCIAVDKEHIFLGAGNRVLEYNLAGEFMNSWLVYNQKSFITSIAIKGSFIYVADAGNRKLFKFNKKGTFEWEIGRKDSTNNFDGFVIPSPYFDVAVGAYDDIWVVNPGRHQVYNLSDRGEVLSTWGLTSFSIEGFSGCCNPSQIAILPNGVFVTYEKGLERIKIYDPTGKFSCVVAGPESFMSKEDLSLRLAPCVADIATDSDGNIYVLDVHNKVKIFVKE